MNMVKRPPDAPTYEEPVIIMGIEKPHGTWQTFKPYRLMPDGTIDRYPVVEYFDIKLAVTKNGGRT